MYVLWMFLYDVNVTHGSLGHTNDMKIKGLGYGPHGG